MGNRNDKGGYLETGELQCSHQEGYFPELGSH